jgi:hypothetical protein
MGNNTEIIGPVTFPQPAGVNINMMPFIIGDADSLPSFLHGYRSMIDACDIEEPEQGKVGYLTIMETPVTPGSSQRRGGVHVERHPGGEGRWGGGTGGWGGGLRADRRYGGLYLASNMPATTAIWDAHIETPGPGGDCAHLQDELGEPSVLAANELAWLTDACPHESLPVSATGTRQFFRLVTSAVDLWYTQHSTPNPLGVTPPARVRLVTTDKFRA